MVIEFVDLPIKNCDFPVVPHKAVAEVSPHRKLKGELVL
jgi:hypothetical protein